MKFVIDQETVPEEISESRRSFLIKTTVLVASFSLISPGAIAITLPEHSVITQLEITAAFLTEKPQDPALIERAAHALLKVNPNFATELETLANLISENKFITTENLKTSKLFEATNQQTAKDILSALYLGYAGQPVMLSSADNVEFVAYAQALTYQLTYPYTPVPSYSRWQSGYWAHLPSSSPSVV